MYGPTYPPYGLGQMYQTGRRFSLAGWSADEWAKFFESAGSAATSFYATVTQKPIMMQPPVQIPTPIGPIPTWAVLGVLGVGAVLLFARPARARRR